MSPAHKARIEESRPRFQQMAREQYGLEVNQGPFGIDSRPALIAEKFAEEQGKGEAFHKAVMDAYWQHARSIDDTALLKEIAASVGLDTEHFNDVLQNLTYDEQVTADVELAHAYRLNGVPALIFANKYLVSGAQPYNVLKQVVERVLAEEGSEP
jgi:predicted DsbA family dithiol-disulfide isomerase